MLEIITVYLRAKTKALHFCIALCTISLFAASLYAAEVTVEGKDANLCIIYNNEACPGDAIAVRLSALAKDGGLAAAGHLPRGERHAASGYSIADAHIELYNGKKRVEKSAFFAVPKGMGKDGELLALIPLSTWLAAGEYTLHITLNQEEDTESAQVPFVIKSKDFISETIPLNERNTSIKTDTSEERMKQIKRLNTILGTVNSQNVFTLKPFIPPVAKNTRRSSHFGDRRVYKYTSGKSSTAEHFGIDYAVPTGTTVAACADGKVVMAENRVSTGWSVAVEHAPALYSLYYHMSSLDVKEGDMVKTGDKLGSSGATGLATGPHLHWEVRLNMCATSPDFWTGQWSSG